jgi:hypothetical protein
MISLYKVPRVVKSIETVSGMEVNKGWREVERRVMSWVESLGFARRVDGEMVAQQCNHI